ncbi:MAG: 16S rRNA (cytidine(1402)-2'-O)-methyltransferase [Candidatus Magasanikbacteria bacterium]|uniref:Ribosomal RNA small subunit methyltransferase I n=1 Tax=Candidatus Magasanikbacteria bacterium CG10_big_fil_rev_8_21_14_0_10_38_6 TaxID=1974647 RepID=A0A2M6NZM2_9BACT|nr:16S rRNA (cytidine(1402)-2'-O)-methyltransferase [Candidatus Magasanikbacteria bacterium]PIR76916.1 MAG: 16S rRNA (cytidine(1402)-2'-O)-methyltransferase [Candidatus Magasanikbacteria bacterium CG10_big_fil_rev_8_21_14_0_10_38_6]
MQTGTLYIVATPIGNLGDITIRVIDTLKAVDVILCEDTRVTQKLLNHFDIKTKTLSYHQHSDDKKVTEIQQLLEQGKHLALVTDAGTPGISDPGNLLINQLQAAIPELVVVPIPGASAVITALSISGLPTDKFLFLGFPPHKNKRKKFFQEVADSKHTVVFYESNHRIEKAIKNLEEVLGNEKQICICRELTKKFETIYRGTILEIIKMDISQKGEFVVVVSTS